MQSERRSSSSIFIQDNASVKSCTIEVCSTTIGKFERSKLVYWLLLARIKVMKSQTLVKALPPRYKVLSIWSSSNLGTIFSRSSSSSPQSCRFSNSTLVFVLRPESKRPTDCLLTTLARFNLIILFSVKALSAFARHFTISVEPVYNLQISS